MAILILHHEGAYNLYSTISDCACYESALTLDQLKNAIRGECGEQGLSELLPRLERAHKSGCSAFDMTLEDCISCNRAGPGETELSVEEFISAYLTRES